MKTFLKKVLDGQGDDESHRYFVRFGKGNYGRRFLITVIKGKRIKVKTSFEFANDIFYLSKELGVSKFSGKILTKEKLNGVECKKKGGLFVYEVIDSSLSEFGKFYYALVDGNSADVVLKTKKALPKPGKNEEKIDDGFCSIELDPVHFEKIRESFLWDVPECKKAIIEHELQISSIIIPSNEKDPVKIRELAKRKGKLVRSINADGKEIKKEYDLEA